MENLTNFLLKQLRNVFPPILLTSSSRFLNALKQNRAQSRLLYLIIIPLSTIWYNWKQFESFFVDLTQILDGQRNSGQNILTVKWLQIWVKRSTDLRHSAVKEYNQGANSITVTRSNVTCSVIWTGICGDKSINYFYLQENTCQRYHSLKVQVDLPPEGACEGIETRNMIKLEIF